MFLSYQVSFALPLFLDRKSEFACRSLSEQAGSEPAGS